MTKTIREMIEVMEAFERGEKIEWRGPYGSWSPCASAPFWNWFDRDYRIAPAVPDSINWSHVAKEFRFLARDSNGKVWLYEQKPIKLSDGWAPSSDEAIVARYFASLKIGTVPWDQSLVERPEGGDA